MGDDERKALEQAEKDANPDWQKIIIEEGGELLLAALGLDNIVGCIKNPDIMTCLWAALDVVSSLNPGGALFKLGKAIWKIGSKIPKLVRIVEKAKKAVKYIQELKSSLKLKNGCGKSGICPSKRGCFVAGTLVLLATGISIPIEQVRVGDVVITTDVVTGATSQQPVTDTIMHTNKPTVNINLGADGSITSTGNHPFWVENSGWVPAERLQPGNHLHTPDGKNISIQNISPSIITTVYNLTVSSNHNYYVTSAGKTSVLVHNDICDEEAKSPARRIRNQHLAGKNHPKTGVPFDKDGYPDFSGYRHPGVTDVQIQLTGARHKDFKLANEAAGLESVRLQGTLGTIIKILVGCNWLKA